MKIVIDIPDDEYCTILTLHIEMIKASKKDCKNANAILNLIESVKSGTILPKGHGRLIDADVAYKKAYNRSLAAAGKEILDVTPTIIPADKGGDPDE